MKKILSILILVTGLIACENQEISFPDFDYTAAYFPYQYPVRTLVLGEYIFPNENDNNHKFEIAAAFGGVYENTLERAVSFQLAPELCNNAKWPNGNPILPLPSTYYTLGSASQISIPAGSTNGRLEVQLTDAFFEDPKSISNNYVIPVRITGVTNLDSILRGKPAVANPDPRKPGDWEVLPKDFTMFCIKYINPYHGKYLHRGTSIVKDGTNATIETTRYAAVYAEKNEVWSLVTSGKNEVTISGSLRSSIVTGQLRMKLNFSENGSCTITENTGSAYTITGTGAYVKNAEEWGGKERDAIFISYQVSAGANTYHAIDTLAMRDRGVALEVYQPVISAK
jgi:hypothetical protein